MVGSPGDIFQPGWGVTNNCRLETSDACQDVVDHIVPPGYFSELRHMPNAEFLSQYNKNSLKRDSGFWFAPQELKESKTWIQVLPVLPITKVLLSDVMFARQLVEWTVPVFKRKGGVGETPLGGSPPPLPPRGLPHPLPLPPPASSSYLLPLFPKPRRPTPPIGTSKFWAVLVAAALGMAAVGMMMPKAVMAKDEVTLVVAKEKVILVVAEDF
nr:probable endo-1,3(4)-beta-glucanase [Tanacetum cinerariifolium]